MAWNFGFTKTPTPANSTFTSMGVTEDEVRQMLSHPGEDRPAADDSRMALGQTSAGRYLRVVYVPDPVGDSAFVVTAYELQGKPPKAFRRRRRRRGK